ncbi:Lrp/AsnC family transcriptional regulator [Deferribacterales bacterium RsTz2092]|nr:AsnC family transcriptional regulator [Deferribacterales bacterium]
MVLDDTDKKIINMLLQSGRVSYTDIARAVNMKPPSVIDRIRKLEGDGIIKGYTATIDYQKLGYGVTAYIGISLESTEHMTTVDALIRNADDALISCCHVAGDFTLIAKVVTETTDSLAHIVKNLRAIQGVTKTNTILIFSTLMDRPRVLD